LEVIFAFGGQMNASDAGGDTPAHICASDTRYGGKVDPKALEVLYKIAPDSFERKNKRGLNPESVANEQQNVARIFFSQIKAQKSAEEARRAEQVARESELKATKSAEEAREAQRQERLLIEKERRMWEKEEQVSETCKALAEDVNELFDCEKRNITVPEGIMVVMSHISCNNNICAMKCPNAMACPTEAKYQEKFCAPGYNISSDGCTRCQQNYGRHRRDPFQCDPCDRHQWTQWLSYAIKPLAIYGVSCWTAQKVEKDQMGSVLKIWLSFSTLVASLSPSIQSSKHFKKVHKFVSSAEAGAGFGSMLSHLTGPSYDCLLRNPAASATDWLFLTVSDMLVLWCLSIIFVLGQWMRTHRSQDFEKVLRDLLKVNIIITNCFLADVVAAFVRYFPCFHFQERPGSPRYLQVEPETMCSDVFWMRISALAVALCLITLGPAYWVVIIRRSKEWAAQDRKLYLGFLISGYRNQDSPQEATSKDKLGIFADVTWWEATVLFRKCTLAMADSMFSVSYAPELFLSSMLLIVGLSLAGHAYVQPYNALFLNRLEFLTLTASFLAVFCTSILQLESVAWATDDTVAIPAFIGLIVTILVPSSSLTILFSMEVIKHYPDKIKRLRERFIGATTPGS